MGSIFEDDEVIALSAGKLKFRNRISRIGQQTLPEGRVNPCSGNDARPISRADLRFKRIDDDIEGDRIDEPFFHEQRLERPTGDFGVVGICPLSCVTKSWHNILARSDAGQSRL